VLIELDGVRILTDPLLRRRVAMLRRSAPLDLSGLEQIDAILVSHVHYDHLDLNSLRRLDRRATVVVPTGARDLLSRLSFEAVAEVSEGHQITVGPLTLEAVHAEHESRRLLGTSTPALGYVVSGSRRVYFLGDTGLFRGMESVAEKTDVALLPIWGWGPRLGSGHLDPRSAAAALARIRPRIAVPIHWGTYFPVTSLASHRAFLHTPPEQFVRAAAELASDVEVHVLPPGGSFLLDSG
jgi:L-ascorbate metabolism protein UlaG (beta-lactamase superfamily)